MSHINEQRPLAILAEKRKEIEDDIAYLERFADEEALSKSSVGKSLQKRTNQCRKDGGIRAPHCTKQRTTRYLGSLKHSPLVNLFPPLEADARYDVGASTGQYQ